MDQYLNPYLGRGLSAEATGTDLTPSVDETQAAGLLARCPAHDETPLHDARDLASQAGVASVYVKDERARMGLGSFKALGAAYCIARDAAATGQDDLSKALEGRTYATASAGNHGLSVAVGAAMFGARSVIYLAESVPEAFAERLRAKGADVARAGAAYEASMEAAARDAEANGWTLLSDSSWPGYTEAPYRVMEGYLQMAAEAASQVPEAPTHILLQAGVGGLAGAVAAYARKVWGDAPEIIVVEPEAAPALIESVRAGRLIDTKGPISNMGRLDCKTPSMIALAGLSRDASQFVTITEDEAERGTDALSAAGYDTTPSGGAGLAALLTGIPSMPSDARVLAFLSEGPEDG